MGEKPEKLAYSIAEACAATSLGTTKLYQLMADGILDARAEGRRTIITVESVKQYIASLPKWKPHQRRIGRPRTAAKHSSGQGTA